MRSAGAAALAEAVVGCLGTEGIIEKLRLHEEEAEAGEGWVEIAVVVALRWWGQGVEPGAAEGVVQIPGEERVLYVRACVCVCVCVCVFFNSIARAFQLTNEQTSACSTGKNARTHS